MNSPILASNNYRNTKLVRYTDGGIADLFRQLLNALKQTFAALNNADKKLDARVKNLFTSTISSTDKAARSGGLRGATESIDGTQKIIRLGIIGRFKMLLSRILSSIISYLEKKEAEQKKKQEQYERQAQATQEQSNQKAQNTKRSSKETKQEQKNKERIEKAEKARKEKEKKAEERRIANLKREQDNQRASLDILIQKHGLSDDVARQIHEEYNNRIKEFEGKPNKFVIAALNVNEKIKAKKEEDYLKSPEYAIKKLKENELNERQSKREKRAQKKLAEQKKNEENEKQKQYRAQELKRIWDLIYGYMNEVKYPDYYKKKKIKEFNTVNFEKLYGLKANEIIAKLFPSADQDRKNSEIYERLNKRNKRGLMLKSEPFKIAQNSIDKYNEEKANQKYVARKNIAPYLFNMFPGQFAHSNNRLLYKKIANERMSNIVKRIKTRFKRLKSKYKVVNGLIKGDFKDDPIIKKYINDLHEAENVIAKAPKIITETEKLGQNDSSDTKVLAAKVDEALSITETKLDAIGLAMKNLVRTFSGSNVKASKESSKRFKVEKNISSLSASSRFSKEISSVLNKLQKETYSKDGKLDRKRFKQIEVLKQIVSDYEKIANELTTTETVLDKNQPLPEQVIEAKAEAQKDVAESKLAISEATNALVNNDRNIDAKISQSSNKVKSSTYTLADLKNSVKGLKELPKKKAEVEEDENENEVQKENKSKSKTKKQSSAIKSKSKSVAEDVSKSSVEAIKTSNAVSNSAIASDIAKKAGELNAEANKVLAESQKPVTKADELLNALKAFMTASGFTNSRKGGIVTKFKKLLSRGTIKETDGIVSVLNALGISNDTEEITQGSRAKQVSTPLKEANKTNKVVNKLAIASDIATTASNALSTANEALKESGQNKPMTRSAIKESKDRSRRIFKKFKAATAYALKLAFERRNTKISKTAFDEFLNKYDDKFIRKALEEYRKLPLTTRQKVLYGTPSEIAKKLNLAGAIIQQVDKSIIESNLKSALSQQNVNSRLSKKRKIKNIKRRNVIFNHSNIVMFNQKWNSLQRFLENNNYPKSEMSRAFLLFNKARVGLLKSKDIDKISSFLSLNNENLLKTLGVEYKKYTEREKEDPNPYNNISLEFLNRGGRSAAENRDLFKFNTRLSVENKLSTDKTKAEERQANKILREQEREQERLKRINQRTPIENLARLLRNSIDRENILEREYSPIDEGDPVAQKIKKRKALNEFNKKRSKEFIAKSLDPQTKVFASSPKPKVSNLANAEKKSREFLRKWRKPEVPMSKFSQARRAPYKIMRTPSSIAESIENGNIVKKQVPPFSYNIANKVRNLGGKEKVDEHGNVVLQKGRKLSGVTRGSNPLANDWYYSKKREHGSKTFAMNKRMNEGFNFVNNSSELINAGKVVNNRLIDELDKYITENKKSLKNLTSLENIQAMREAYIEPEMERLGGKSLNEAPLYPETRPVNPKYESERRMILQRENVNREAEGINGMLDKMSNVFGFLKRKYGYRDIIVKESDSEKVQNEKVKLQANLLKALGWLKSLNNQVNDYTGNENDFLHNPTYFNALKSNINRYYKAASNILFNTTGSVKQLESNLAHIYNTKSMVN